METLTIEATKCTPAIHLDSENRTIEIRGESYPENTATFYRPVFEWVEKYLASITDEEVIVNMEMIYFNSSTSKVLMDFFDLLEDAAATGKNVVLNWCYDEENDMALEYGEEFMEDIQSLKFNLKVV